ncbi:hypothetical protein MKW94_017154, partial [Papaver nudicaule]|nr:hypothetical protein [Papaver nudicaule]
MGFAEDLVVRVIDENGEGNEERILEDLLSYKAINESLQGGDLDISTTGGSPSPPRKRRKLPVNIPRERIGLEKKLLDAPYFYIEKLALPDGDSLQNIKPESMDSKYFSAAAKERHYIHNLPTLNRSQLLPVSPMTIAEALPLTTQWWPSWDTRTQLNCLLSCTGSEVLTGTVKRINETLETCGGDPPAEEKHFIMFQCEKWNLVWTGKNRVSPLEPEHIEVLLGYPRGHTRVGRVSQIDRYR